MSDPLAPIDYASAGTTIQYALLDHAKRFPNKTRRPQSILWNGLKICNSNWLTVPKYGILRLEFLSVKTTVAQGFDVIIDNGWIELAMGEHIPHLRTWWDDKYEDILEYPYFSKDGEICTWNVYEMTYRNGKTVEEKWTGNAGFWIETVSESERVYHCSHGMAIPPDFESLVYKVSFRERNEMSV